MKNKKIKILTVFVKMFYAIMIVLLFYIVGVLVQIDRSCDNQEDNVSKTEIASLEDKALFAADFPGCSLLNKKCLGAECDKYFLCSDRKYLVCEIYDCGEEFGIGTKDENGEINRQRKAKEDKEKIIKIKEKCAGTVEVLESDCLDEKLEMKVKVITNGDCQIAGFWVGQMNKETKPVKFSNLENGLYLVVANSCEEVSELIAAGENGISIE